jgi:hypothetical protein
MTRSVPPVTCHGQEASCTGHSAGNALRARHRSAGRHRARRRTADKFRRADPVWQLTRRTFLSRTPMCISVPRRLLRLTTDPTTTPHRVRQSVNGPIRASKDTRSVSAHRRRVAQDGQEPLQENYQRAGVKSTRGSETDRKAVVYGQRSRPCRRILRSLIEAAALAYRSVSTASPPQSARASFFAPAGLSMSADYFSRAEAGSFSIAPQVTGDREPRRAGASAGRSRIRARRWAGLTERGRYKSERSRLMYSASVTLCVTPVVFPVPRGPNRKKRAAPEGPVAPV